MSNFFKAPTSNYVQTTLNGSITDADTSILLNDATNLQAPGYIVIDRLDANGVSTPASREVVYFTGISTNTLTGCQRGADRSTAQSHADNARVETMLTVGMWNSLTTIVSSVISTTGNITTNNITYSVAKMNLNSNASGGIACDFDTANLFTRVLNASTTVSLTNWATGDKGVVRLVQGISGATVTWNPGSGATIKWADGADPVLTASLSKADSFGFIGVTDTEMDGYILGQNI